MRILIDIGHPAHVHLFKNLVLEMQQKGHAFFFTVREGENEDFLLKKFGFSFKKIGVKRKSKFGKILGLIHFSLKILYYSFKFKPDIFVSHGSMYAGIAAFIYRKPHIAMEDSGNMEQIRLSLPFSSVIVSPDILPVDLGKKQLSYKGYHEIAYLHPDYFSPTEDIYQFLGLRKNDKYAIVRFVAWEASHDIGQKGFSEQNKLDLIELLGKYFTVFISAEGNLPESLKKHQIQIPFDKMHSALYYASLYVGEGATMASEAGVLGTPSIYVSTIQRCYNIDQEKYGTVFNSTDFDAIRDKILNIALDESSSEHYKSQRDFLLKEKINVTKFFIWFIENYPESIQILKENPNYQYNFK